MFGRPIVRVNMWLSDFVDSYPELAFIEAAIRQYIPKGADFDDFSDVDILNIQHKLNRRPREKLKFISPIQTLYRIIS